MRLELTGIVKSLAGKVVLDSIDLVIEPGQVLAIIGPSGGGKSTLIRTMNFLEMPDHGIVRIDGKQLTLKNANKIRRHIGMVFQTFNLFPHMTVLENIQYAQMRVAHKSAKKATEVALSLLERMGLLGQQGLYPSQLSGGQKQRTAIARAKAMDPKLLLFDEPTSALDPESVKDVLDNIKSLAHHDITVVIVTHEMKFAENVADKILFLDHGRVVEYTKAKEFFRAPKTKRARAFLNKML